MNEDFVVVYDCEDCDRQATFIAHSCGCDFGQAFFCTRCASENVKNVNCLGVSLYFC